MLLSLLLLLRLKQHSAIICYYNNISYIVVVIFILLVMLYGPCQEQRRKHCLIQQLTIQHTLRNPHAIHHLLGQQTLCDNCKFTA